MLSISFILSLLALHCSVFASPPEPIDVHFSSVNLKNVLHWVQGNDSSKDTLFIVEYAVYGDSTEGNKGRRVHWRAVEQCTRIVQTRCDLSKETQDEEQGYYARVRSVHRKIFSKWIRSQRRFDPKSETSFGPPLVTVEIENNSAIITMTGPMRHLLTKNSTFASMQTTYPQMAYNLSIKNTNRNQMNHFIVVSSPYKYRLMDHNTLYCFSAQSKFLHMPVECQSSAWQCITTPPDPVVENLKMVIVGIVVPALCLCVIAVVSYVLYQYLTGNGQKSPYTLKSPIFHPSPFTIDQETMSRIQIHPKDDSPPDLLMLPGLQHSIVGPPPSYSPQILGSSLNPEEPVDVIDYGFISKACKDTTDGEKEEHEGGRFPREEGRIGNVQMASDQRGSYLTQNLPRTCHPIPTGTQTMSGPLQQECGWSVLNPDTQSQSLLQPFQQTTERVREDNTSQENGEVVPLLSAYASQYQNRSNSTNVLPDDYGVLGLHAAQNTHEEYFEDEDEDEDEGTIHVDWDPETGKFIVPKVEIGSGVMGGLRGTNERPYMNNGGLRLENVFVRQRSEEEMEAQRELERSSETGCVVEDVFKKWHLKISNNE